MRFDLTDLRLFVQVAETASITHGAEQTKMALASASARIRGMEAVLGVPLLERQPRGVKLNSRRPCVGSPRACRAATARADAGGTGGKYAHGLKGHVRLLSNTIASTEFLPEALGSFLASHPNVDIELEERPSHEIVQAVGAGFADVGIVVDLVDLANLETFPFATDQLVLIAPRDHPLGSFRQIAFRELLGQEFVGLNSANALQNYLGQQAVRAGRTLKLRVQLSGFDAICRMVEHGVGIAVVPETATRFRRRRAITVVRLTDAWALRKLMLCVRRFDDLSDQAKQLIDHLKGRSRAKRS